MLFGIVRRRRFCYLILACDYARYRRWSPGMILFERAMDAWFAAGGEVFDFTIGDEPFKSALGCIRTPLFRLGRAATPRGAAYLARMQAR